MRGVYRPSSVQPRGAWARHLDAQRKARDLSQTEAFELVYQRIGWSAKSRSAYRAIDIGDRQPKDNEAKVLAEEFGWPTEQGESIQADPTDLAAALNRQSAAIEALVQELRLARATQIESTDAQLRALVSLGAHLEPSGTSADSGHEAPSGTGR